MAQQPAFSLNKQAPNCYQCGHLLGTQRPMVLIPSQGSYKCNECGLCEDIQPNWTDNVQQVEDNIAYQTILRNYEKITTMGYNISLQKFFLYRDVNDFLDKQNENYDHPSIIQTVPMIKNKPIYNQRNHAKPQFIQPVQMHGHSALNHQYQQPKPPVKQPSILDVTFPVIPPAQQRVQDLIESKANDNRAEIHISSIISSLFIHGTITQPNPFLIQEYYAKEIDEKYVEAYLYHIQISDDPNKSQFAILTSKPIPDVSLNHIKFPIQIDKDIESQNKKHIQNALAHKQHVQSIPKLNQNKEEFNIKLSFSKEYKQNCSVTLRRILSIGDDATHKIKEDAFKIIKETDAFLFEKLDQTYSKHKKHTPLRRYNPDEIETQNRFFLVCPLKVMGDNMVIDYDRIKKIHMAAGYHPKVDRMNAAQWCGIYKSPLKNELVELRKSNKHVHTLCVSYGLDEDKYNTIRKQRNDTFHYEQIETYSDRNGMDAKCDDHDDIQSVSTFANESVAFRFKSMKARNKKKLSNEKQGFVNKYAVLLREEQSTVHNILIASLQKERSAFSLQQTLQYACLEEIYPTAIPVDMWYALKNIPSILWRLETWFNVSDLHHTLSTINNNTGLASLLQQNHDTEQKIDLNDIDIDLTLLYEALHRSKLTTNMNYQLFNNLGAYILKYLATIFYFVKDVNSGTDEQSAQQLNIDVQRIMAKTASSDVLCAIANKYKLESYGVLYDFDFENWNPPQFQMRDTHSLLGGTRPYDLIKKDHDDDKYLGAYLLQSIVGVYWSSVLHKQSVMGNSISYGINHSLEFLTRLSILPGDFNIDPKMSILSGTQMRYDQNIVLLKEYLFGDIELNILLYASLKAALEDSKRYALAGITRDRLEVLGDAVLDMLFVWFIFMNIADDKHIYDVWQIYSADDIGFKEHFREYMSDGRHLFVNNNSLGYSFYKKIYSQTQYLDWYDKYEENAKLKHEIQQYETQLKKLQAKEKQNDDNDTTDLNYYEMMKQQKSPGGWIRSKSTTKWPLKIRAPEIFGQTFEVVLGAIFLGSNCDNIFLPKEPEEAQPFECDELRWNFEPSIEFLKKYLGNENFNDTFWNKWT
eukprot:1160397_1